MTRPTLRFNEPTEIALTGADMRAEINGIRAPLWKALALQAGDVLRMRGIIGPGTRAYIAIRGGLQVPRYLGSRATFTLGNFGGHGGRALRLGDVLPMGEHDGDSGIGNGLPSSLIPSYTNAWEIGVLYGPHGEPDFFTEADIEMIFSTDWKVHFNSNRTGIRLIGPKPQWARTDGGEAGLHPSNIHDNAYAIGAIDFTGDMPIILGPDGPSLGGFVCPACIAESELWKMGQLKPGDTVRFRRMPTGGGECAREVEQDREVAGPPRPAGYRKRQTFDPAKEEDAVHGIVCPRSPGGWPCAIGGRATNTCLWSMGRSCWTWPCVSACMRSWSGWRRSTFRGIIDLTPGIRSLQVHFESRTLPLDDLMKTLLMAESELPEIDQIEVPSRIVHLPLSWGRSLHAAGD